MVIVGLKKDPKPNFVALDTRLPLPFTKGSISVNLQWEGHPTGSITIQSIPETEIDSYRKVYSKIGLPIVLFSETKKPLFFEIASYAEGEDFIFVNDSLVIKAYDISVSLRGGHERKITKPIQLRKTGKSLNTFASHIGVPYEGYNYFFDIPPEVGAEELCTFDDYLRRKLRLSERIVDFNSPVIRTPFYKEGKVWQITNQDILSTIEVSKQEPFGYKNTELVGNFDTNLLNPSDFKPDIEKKSPEIIELVEGDEYPDRPPLDVKKIKTLDMNFDFSGPRKTIKKTTLYNGQPLKEEVITYGFAYLAQNIRNPAAEAPNADFDVPALLTTSPESYWTVIEHLTTIYEYKEADLKISIKAVDKKTKKPIRVRYFGNDTIFRAKYLTSITTKGWRLARFQQEQFDETNSSFNGLDSRWLNDELNSLDITPLERAYARARLKSITFIKVPYNSITQYKLVAESSQYTVTNMIPYQTQELDLQGFGRVIAAIPDPSFVPPMLIMSEQTLTQSFDQMDHPENILIRDERLSIINDDSLSNAQKTEYLKELKLLPWLTTGEDTYQVISRKILPSANTKRKNKKRKTDIYLEYEYNASNQDAQFQYSLQEGVFRTIAGRPSTASYLPEEYGPKNDNEKEDEDRTYRIYLDSGESLEENTDSVQYDTDSLSAALKAAKADLEINNFLSVNDINLTLAWFYPEIRPGDYIEFVDDRSKEKLRVKGVSFTIEYQGHVDGRTHRVCNGTSLSCGVFKPKNITYTKKSSNASSASSGDVELESIISGEDILGKDIYARLRTRRNPDGDDYDS